MNLTDIENLKIGDIIAVYTENSTHTGHYCGIVDSHIPRIVLAGSHKFILQPDEKQCFDHTFSIDLDKIMDVHVIKIKKVKESTTHD